MSDFSRAIKLIKKYEGFSEKAYPDPCTGTTPYTLGFGTQYYPDGAPVRQGHCCTEHKATEYLHHEVEVINEELLRLNLGLDQSMVNALVSFVHSIGWEPFLYSPMIDVIEVEDWRGAADQITRWIFDHQYRVVGGLLDRRREESLLFLSEIRSSLSPTGGILLRAFSKYGGAEHEIQAIEALEHQMNPYILAEFANQFDLEATLDFEQEYAWKNSSFDSWD
jgi:lysozyme